MKYASNILPTQSSFYVLNNSSIVDGILKISAGGSAACEIDETMLSALTNTMRLSLFSSTEFSNYSSDIKVQITAISVDNTYYNHTCIPTKGTNGIYTAEVAFEATQYSYMLIRFVSKVDVAFTLWELCPEATDESITVAIAGVEQSLPKLLYDYNTQPFIIGTDENTISIITYHLQSSTDLQGHLQMSYIASEPCTLTLRFKDNGATELFSPLLYDLHAGRGNIGVPHAYLHRLAGNHNVTVTAQISKGIITVDTRGLLFTIDGGYLAWRSIDVGADIRDITIRQRRADSGPSEVWVIGIENNEVLVRKRDYNERTTAGYLPVYALGAALDAAIEFDGDWVRRTSDDKHTIETYDEPYIFLIETDNTLVVQLGDDESTKYVLDKNVTALSVCRGYKSTNYPENDQGLICAYIKNGKPYYRAYVYNKALEAYAWDYARQLTDETVSSIQVHRLNDYRVGIVVTTTTQNLWYISDRTYVEQSVKSERAYISLSAPEGYCSLYPIENPYEPSYIADVTTNEAGNTRIIVTCNYPIICTRVNVLNYITVVGCKNGLCIDAVNVSGNILTVDLNMLAFSNVTLSLIDFRFMHKIPYHGWVFITNTSWLIRIPTAPPDTVHLNLSNSIGFCSMTPVLHNKVSLETGTASLHITGTSCACIQRLITKRDIVHDTLDTVHIALSGIATKAALIRIGVEPI